MGLLDHRDVPTREPFDEPELPEGTAAVEELGLEPLEQGEQLGLLTRGGERGEAHVEVDVEAVVVDPDRVPGVEGDPLEPLPEPGDVVEP